MTQWTLNGKIVVEVEVNLTQIDDTMDTKGKNHSLEIDIP
jgi:hypothetical protein